LGTFRIALGWKMFLNFMNIWNILWYNLWQFAVIWYIFPILFGPRKIWQPWSQMHPSEFLIFGGSNVRWNVEWKDFQKNQGLQKISDEPCQANALKYYKYT
jgi:hypothetical protein